MKKQKIPAVILALLFSISLISLPSVWSAENNPPQTLADTINTILEGVQEKNSSWNVIYDQIFCRQNTTVYDNAITQALNTKDYREIIYIARLAELNNYTSPIITNSLKTALQDIPMTGSLPITHTGTDFPNSFILYDRYMINGYRYAQTLNINRWNITTAYNDFTKAYNTPPINSVSGEMLWLNPQQGIAHSFSSRYYDEHAETLSMFLHFALNGIPDATTYADDTWEHTQTHWSGEIYGYLHKDSGVECEMGNFAQIITQYKNTQGHIPYFDRVISDLENKLLTNQYNSKGWGSVGVIKHAENNNQARLYETLGNLVALQMLYPQFTKGNQTNFQNMLTQGWRGLVNSSLFSNNQFSFMDEHAGVAGKYQDEASLLGAMTLFLHGTIPQTGSLAITASEERYHDYRTCFQTSQWQFNYAAHSIRIPLTKGDLTFIFGSQPVTQNFPENAVYNIQFSDDWNTITSISTVDNLTPPAPHPTPTTTTNPTPTPTTTTNPTPSSEDQTIPPTTLPVDVSSKQVPVVLFAATGLTATVTVFLLGMHYYHKKPKNYVY